MINLKTLHVERNFKEAKRLKEEVENLNAKGKDNQTKLECIIDEQNKDSVELENAEKDFEIISGELKKKVFESGITYDPSATYSFIYKSLCQYCLCLFLGIRFCTYLLCLLIPLYLTQLT